MEKPYQSLLMEVAQYTDKICPIITNKTPNTCNIAI